MNFKKSCFGRLLLLTLCGILTLSETATAKDKLASSLTKIAALDVSRTDQPTIRKNLGAPAKVEVKTRKTAWVYFSDRSKLVVEWEGLPANIKKLNFEMLKGPLASALDYSLADKLHDGETTMVQALKIFGIPAEMEMKEKSQEICYVFADKKLRLFFRDRVLVDFALY